MLLLPLAIEHLDGKSRLSLDLGHDELFQLRCEFARYAPVGAPFGMQSGKAAALMGIPPVFQSAHGHRLAGTLGRCQGRRRGGPFQSDFERYLLPQKFLDFADETKTRQGQSLGPIGR